MYWSSELRQYWEFVNECSANNYPHNRINHPGWTTFAQKDAVVSAAELVPESKYDLLAVVYNNLTEFYFHLCISKTSYAQQFTTHVCISNTLPSLSYNVNHL